MLSDNKIANVSELLYTKSWDTVLKEIAKCELVCSNCHKERTYQRLRDSGKACKFLGVGQLAARSAWDRERESGNVGSNPTS